jgi:hypothetical protein
MTFNLFRHIKQHVDFFLVRPPLNHALHHAPHPSRAFTTWRALTAALMLVEVRQSRNGANNVS